MKKKSFVLNILIKHFSLETIKNSFDSYNIFKYQNILRKCYNITQKVIITERQFFLFLCFITNKTLFQNTHYNFSHTFFFQLKYSWQTLC